MPKKMKEWAENNPEEFILHQKQAHEKLLIKYPNNQSDAGKIGGKSTAKKRKEQGYYWTEFWTEMSLKGLETQRILGIGAFRPRTPEDIKYIAKWKAENPERVKEIGRENIKKAQAWCKENYYGTESHIKNFSNARTLANKKVLCPCCKKSIAYSTAHKNHFDNCYVNTMKDLYDNMPNEGSYTVKELFVIFNNKINIEYSDVKKFVYKHPFITIIEGLPSGAVGKYKKIQ
jgi:hypothetical protein